MATQSPYSLPVLGLLIRWPNIVLASISLSVLQKFTGSYPKSRCLTAETMTCHQATMWCPSRCSLLRINQRCSAARASSGTRSVLSRTLPQPPTCNTPVLPSSSRLLWVWDAAAQLGLSTEAGSKSWNLKGSPPAVWTKLVFVCLVRFLLPATVGFYIAAF